MRMSKFFRRMRRLFPGRDELRADRTALLLSALSGLTGAFLFPRFHFSTLAWIALTPYLYALTRVRGRGVVWATLCFGLPWYYLSLWWLNTLTVFNPFIPLGALVLPLVLTLYFLIFAFPASWALRRQPVWLSPLSVALLWTAVEYLRSLGEIAFPWNLLGYSQGTGPFRLIIQWAEVGSVYIVSFFVALSNAGLAVAVRRFVERPAGETPRRALLPALLIWMGPASLLFLGWICALGLDVYARREIEFRSQDQTTSTLTIAVIQPNVSQLDKWAMGDPSVPEQKRRSIEYETLHRTLGMVRTLGAARTTGTAESAGRPQLYILPETAFLTPYFVYDLGLHDYITSVAREVDADIFFGADAREPRDIYLQRLKAGFREPDPDFSPSTFTLPRLVERTDPKLGTIPAEPGEMAAFNSAWLVTPEQGLTDHVYHKVQLVPFGETAPILGHIPGFQDYVMTVGSFQAGMEQTLFETQGLRYGAMICFESAFSYLGRGLARGGARFITILTNDAWYDPAYLKERGGFFATLFRLPLLRTLAASGPDQHFQMAVFRAIETRLPVVRAANTGISAVIDGTGRVVESRPFGTQDVIVHQLSAPYQKPTAFVRRGDGFARLCLGTLFLIGGLEFHFRRRDRRRAAEGK